MAELIAVSGRPGNRALHRWLGARMVAGPTPGQRQRMVAAIACYAAFLMALLLPDIPVSIRVIGFRAELLLPSVAGAGRAMAIGLVVMFPLMWWHLSYLDPRFQ